MCKRLTTRRGDAVQVLMREVGCSASLVYRALNMGRAESPTVERAVREYFAWRNSFETDISCCTNYMWELRDICHKVSGHRCHVDPPAPPELTRAEQAQFDRGGRFREPKKFGKNWI